MLSTERTYRNINLQSNLTRANIIDTIKREYEGNVSYIGMIENVDVINKDTFIIEPEYSKTSNTRVSLVMDIKYFSVPAYFYLPNCKILDISADQAGTKILLSCSLKDLDGKQIKYVEKIKILITTNNKSAESIRQFRTLEVGNILNLMCVRTLITENNYFICSCDLINSIQPILVKYEFDTQFQFIDIKQIPNSLKNIFVIPKSKEANLIKGEEYLFCVTGWYKKEGDYTQLNFVNRENTELYQDENNKLEEIIGYNDVNKYLLNILYNWKLLIANTTS